MSNDGEVQVKVEPQQVLAALLAPLAFVLAFILTAASIGCTARHAPIRERPKALDASLPPGVLTTINGVIYVPRGRLAYEAEVAYLLAAGQRVRREDLVSAVTAPMYRGMVSREEAETWAAGLVPPP